tara:strand:+ start:404 stop:1558 length:1155 start_codon:yes stop_codon:yes gene_type:complete
MVSVSRQAIPWFDAVWVWDETAGAYIDNTLESRRPAGTAFTILEDSDDYLYLGSPGRFDLAGFLLSTNGSLGDLTYEYYSGSAWVEFVPGTRYLYASGEGTGVEPLFDNYDFTNDGAETFELLRDWGTLVFSNGTPHSAEPPDGSTRYWVRISTASITTAPTVNQIIMRPYAAYCRHTDVSNLMQLDVAFSSSTTPTDSTVEDAIFAAQGRIDTSTRRSWRIGYQKNEHHEFNLAGMKLDRAHAWHVTDLQVWNGSEFQTRTSGRNQDYFLLPDINMVHWSRYFVLPARFQSVSSTLGWWGWGEFIMPVRATYFYGRDIAMDSREGPMVFDIARKMAAIDIWQSHDYSLLAVSGTDKITLDRKVENWKLQIEDDLDKLTAWEVF